MFELNMETANKKFRYGSLVYFTVDFEGLPQIHQGEVDTVSAVQLYYTVTGAQQMTVK